MGRSEALAAVTTVAGRVAFVVVASRLVDRSAEVPLRQESVYPASRRAKLPPCACGRRTLCRVGSLWPPARKQEPTGSMRRPVDVQMAAGRPLRRAPTRRRSGPHGARRLTDTGSIAASPGGTLRYRRRFARAAASRYEAHSHADGPADGRSAVPEEHCQWQSKTAHSWQSKTAHLHEGPVAGCRDLGRGR